jgi:dTDP-glucose 4,6-dehydratase
LYTVSTTIQSLNELINSIPMKHILITGGSGFIGSNFVHVVLEKAPDCLLINLDKLTYAGNPRNLADIEKDPRYIFIKGDIRDRDLVEGLFDHYAIDTVVHFAAESHVDRSITGPDEFIGTNINGTFTLLEAARKSWLSKKAPSSLDNPRFLHVSTDEIYGSLGESGSFREDTPYDPRSPYSASKAASNHLVSAYFHTYGLPVLITNCSNNYGPCQFPEKLIPLIINNALNGTELPVYGDGKHIRDWLYVMDHCEAIVQVIEKGVPGECYNIGGNNERENIEIVKTICSIIDEAAGPLKNSLPRESLIRFVKDRPGHDRRYAIDATKIRETLGWTPSVSFDEGIRHTVTWYLTNQAWIASVLDGSYKHYYKRMYADR